MQSDFFGRASIEEYTLASGEVRKLPIRYYDYATIGASFPASAARVRELLPSSRVRPVQIVPGMAVVVLAAMEYRRLTDAGGREGTPYNELAVMIPVLDEPAINVPALPLLIPDRFKTFGLYVHHLPVTTAEARDLGIEFWGYPKFLAEITFTDTEHARACRLRADGKDILTLEIAKLPTRPRRLAYYTYTVKDGQLLRTRFETQGEYGIASFRGGASYTLGDHPIAEELRGLRMGHVALEREFAPRVQAMLHPPAGRRPDVPVQQRLTVAARR